ncbi:PIG-L deacetylase family protein [Actinophytocola sp. NPDC049390]|uniref:PIG-L deacetylase family protein n=1 Tax=Actinophytocola sp. NPDC049390 TaxID=3363894 RepID=UPI00378F3F32
MRVLMLASFGLEIVECAGALAKAIAAGDEVHAAVLLCRDTSRPQITAAAKVIGIEQVTYLNGVAGEIEVTPAAKMPIVRLLREFRPDVVIMQDPQHAQHDLDPDRRMIALLYAESLAMSSRDWRIEECGGHAPHGIPTIYYMTPEHPNCVVEIEDVLEIKQRALDVLTDQNTFSAQHWREHASVETLARIAPGWSPDDGDAELGRLGQRQIFLALALSNGLGSHSGATLGEPYRREGTFLVDRLTE